MKIVIYGEENFLMNQKLEMFKKEFSCNEDNMNFSVYRGDEDSMEIVYEDLITPPFFTEKKLVVLKNPIFLTSKKIKKDEGTLSYFEKCLDIEDENIIFLIYYYGNDFDERKKSVKRLRKEAKFYEFEKMNYYKLSDSIRQAIKNRGATIDEDALELLINRIDENLNQAILEVDKLCLYDKHITKNVVDSLVSKPLDENVFSLTSAILQKDQQKMFAVYKDLMVLNEEVIKLIVLISRQMRLMYQVKLLDRKGYTDKEIGKILAINPYRLKYLRQEGKAFDISELLRCLDELAILDEQIKTGKIDKKLGLELFMMRI